ncbi:MAG: phospholipase D-like domain-containing protein [Rhodospirillaceae bacterium]|nr:phospholipase D-like domain-containing protein [Rhodospirillaceae bacterium]
MESDLSLATVLHLVIALPLCGHVLLRKDQEPVAVGWIALILLSPFIGSGLYWLFGINRVERRARRLRERPDVPVIAAAPAMPSSGAAADPRYLRLAGSVSELPFLPGNTIEPLVNGDEAYPAMLDAIKKAQRSVALSVYIFDDDPTGRKFVEALAEAVKRGVAVRVLIDDVGLRYSVAAIDAALEKAGVRTARFMPRTFRFLPFLNLRNHRKIMVVDGEVGFIGGMNIRHGNVVVAGQPEAVQDIHFRVRGPVVDQMTGLFEEDWHFAADEEVTLPRTARPAAAVGAVTARVVPDGPDHRVDTLQWLILGMLAMSQKRVRIMTPYFIPNGILLSALAVAAMRGVEIEVVVPERTNLPFVGWAMAANFERLLAQGVKIHLNPPPFDHSKLMVVDGQWTLLGSANWDQRSLRLNFEANLECLDEGLGAILEAYIQSKISLGREISLAAVRAAPLWVRLRNNFVRLFGPYL